MDWLGQAATWFVSSALGAGFVLLVAKRYFDRRDADARRKHESDLAQRVREHQEALRNLESQLRQGERVAESDADAVRSAWLALNEAIASLSKHDLDLADHWRAALPPARDGLRLRFGETHDLVVKFDAARESIANLAGVALGAQMDRLKRVLSGELKPGEVDKAGILHFVLGLMPARSRFGAFEDAARPFIRGDSDGDSST